jgi:hypothetical protein
MSTQKDNYEQMRKLADVLNTINLGSKEHPDYKWVVCRGRTVDDGYAIRFRGKEEWERWISEDLSSDLDKIGIRSTSISYPSENDTGFRVENVQGSGYQYHIVGDGDLNKLINNAKKKYPDAFKDSFRDEKAELNKQTKTEGRKKLSKRLSNCISKVRGVIGR